MTADNNTPPWIAAGISRRQFIHGTVIVSAAVLGSSFIAACGGSSGAKPVAGQAPDIAAAKKEGSLLLYTSLDPTIVASITSPFEKQYGIHVDVFRSGSVTITEKLLNESAVGQIRADVVDSSDVSSFIVMKDQKILRPYKSKEAATIAAQLRDSDNYWVADRLTQSVIQYNTKQVSATDAPKSWRDLTNSSYKGKLAYWAVSNGDDGEVLWTLAQRMGGYQLLKDYAANNPMRVDVPQTLTQVIEKGERSVAFAQSDNIAWLSKKNGEATDYIYPAEGVPSELGAVGITAQAPHPNAAMLFYDWWIGVEGQSLLTAGGKYSSRSDVAPPKGAPKLSDLKLWVVNLESYQAQRQSVLTQLAAIFGGQWGSA